MEISTITSEVTSDAITAESLITITFEAAGGVGTGSIDMAVVKVGKALVDIFAALVVGS